MNPGEKKKASVTLSEILEKRSKKGLEFARRTILKEMIECETLREALEHYTSNWKDFTHPGLFSIACEVVGGNPDKAVEVQAVIAMIAAALDVHDDIIDKSDRKHGKRTVFGKFGQDIALVLGDVFFVSGFTLLGKSIAELPGKKAKEIFETLGRALLELGSAHILESNLKGKMNAAPEEYMRILKMKAATVEADMRIGAIVGKGTNSEIEVLAKYGRILGILATLREEFIDIFEIDELSHRIQSECLPIPILYAMQHKDSKEKIQKLFAKKQLTSGDVDEALDIVFGAKGVRKLKKMMQDLVKESIYLVSKIKPNKSKILRSLATSTLKDL